MWGGCGIASQIAGILPSSSGVVRHGVLEPPTMLAKHPVVPSNTRSPFLDDVLAGLSRPQKALPGKYLWDEIGSDLFDRICGTDDYYLTRREMALLEEAAPEVAEIVGAGACLVEYGSGASRKVRILLDAMERPSRYVAIDISAEYLDAATERIAADYPHVAVQPVVADYTQPIVIPGRTGGEPILGFFPGSTIGNFARDGVITFLERARATIGHGWLLIGHDPNQDEATLERAYGEADGLMAALHLNLLRRLRTDLGADVDMNAFHHEVRIRRDPPRVEAYLTATRATSLRIAGHVIPLGAGESIHTDMSYKMDTDVFRDLTKRAGWATVRTWLDPDGFYGLHLLRTT
jgi:dimethylhistidine N-methyltransferase